MDPALRQDDDRTVVCSLNPDPREPHHFRILRKLVPEKRRELIDAILNHSLPLNIGPDQWLEVGAHMMETPQSQRGVTLMIRVKGSDLAIFAADPARRDEIRSRVEVRAF